MVYLIVDNRDPGEVPYTGLRLKNGGSPVANWSDPIRKKPTSSGSLPINTMGLRAVPYYWAGVFVLEIARFLYPRQHFGLVDNDCVPVTLFETPELVALATSQMQWTDLVGIAPDDPKHTEKVGYATSPPKHTWNIMQALSFR